MSAVAGIVCSINNEQNKQNRTMANLNAMTYAERMKTDIMKGIAVSDSLRQIIISEDGQLNKFYEIAEEMMADSVQSIQIAPDGVVTDIYPAEGNTYSYSYRIFYFYRICSVSSYLGLADIKRK